MEIYHFYPPFLALRYSFQLVMADKKNRKPVFIRPSTKKAVREGQPDDLNYKFLPFVLAVHPALVVIASSVLLRCEACGLFEDLDEVGLG